MIKVKDGMFMGDLTIAVQEQEINRLKNVNAILERKLAKAIEQRNQTYNSYGASADEKSLADYDAELEKVT